MTTRASVSRCLTVSSVLIVLAFAVAAAAEPAPPKPTVSALNPAVAAPVRPPMKVFPDLVVLTPTVNSWLVPASGGNPAGYQVVWKIKNQGAAPTASRVKLTLACQPAAWVATAQPTPEKAAQICHSLNNTSYLTYPPGQPTNAPAPLAAHQESEPFVTLSSTAAISCKAWHAKITAVADADNKYDEGPLGEGNNTKVFEICEMKVVPR
jgi:hypothetical protein